MYIICGFVARSRHINYYLYLSSNGIDLYTRAELLVLAVHCVSIKFTIKFEWLSGWRGIFNTHPVFAVSHYQTHCVDKFVFKIWNSGNTHSIRSMSQMNLFVFNWICHQILQIISQMKRKLANSIWHIFIKISFDFEIFSNEQENWNVF